MSAVSTSIRSKISLHFKPLFISLIDESHLHAGHAAMKGIEHQKESHFYLELVSELFKEKSKVERHRMVYNVLQEEMKKIHALRMDLKDTLSYNILCCSKLGMEVFAEDAVDVFKNIRDESKELFDQQVKLLLEIYLHSSRDLIRDENAQHQNSLPNYFLMNKKRKAPGSIPISGVGVGPALTGSVVSGSPFRKMVSNQSATPIPSSASLISAKSANIVGTQGLGAFYSPKPDISRQAVSPKVAKASSSIQEEASESFLNHRSPLPTRTTTLIRSPVTPLSTTPLSIPNSRIPTSLRSPIPPSAATNLPLRGNVQSHQQHQLQPSFTPRDSPMPPLKKLPPLNEIDQYEITEYEESDRENRADNEEKRRRRRQKTIPLWTKDWARKAELQLQIDPDSIFYCTKRFPICNLQRIFGTIRKPRGSSEYWGNGDGLTEDEIKKYKARMGWNE
jgi:BolA-like protein 1